MRSLASICHLTVLKTGSFLSCIVTWTTMIDFHKKKIPKSSARLLGIAFHQSHISSTANTITLPESPQHDLCHCYRSMSAVVAQLRSINAFSSPHRRGWIQVIVWDLQNFRMSKSLVTFIYRCHGVHTRSFVQRVHLTFFFTKKYGPFSSVFPWIFEGCVYNLSPPAVRQLCALYVTDRPTTLAWRVGQGGSFNSPICC